MITGKTITLTRQTFVSKVMSLLFNMLSRLVIDFLVRSKCHLISWLQSPSAVILEAKKIKSVTLCRATELSPALSNLGPLLALEETGGQGRGFCFGVVVPRP